MSIDEKNTKDKTRLQMNSKRRILTKKIEAAQPALA